MAKNRKTLKNLVIFKRRNELLMAQLIMTKIIFHWLLTLIIMTSKNEYFDWSFHNSQYWILIQILAMKVWTLYLTVHIFVLSMRQSTVTMDLFGRFVINYNFKLITISSCFILHATTENNFMKLSRTSSRLTNLFTAVSVIRKRWNLTTSDWALCKAIVPCLG